ncbi:hypothetical protein [Paenibacillus sp. FSL R5-0473]|uniref:hypothetical protein n=1 Tax=Paenibacillus sp. FSL R5-0473 TaxID=2921642 RepID=UPI0030FC0A99
MLEKRLDYLNQVESSLKLKSLLERMTNPNKKGLTDVSAEKARINGEILSLREKSPTPEQIQTIVRSEIDVFYGKATGYCFKRKYEAAYFGIE